MIKKQSNNKKPVVSELKKSLLSAKKSFIMVGLFSMFINILMLVPPLYMLQLYDRVLGSRSQDTLIMLTLIVVVLFITMGLLEVVRSRVLVRVGNKLDSMLSQRIFDNLFELERKAPGRSSSMPLNDLTQVRQFMTGNGLFAFFDAPWMPIYIIVLFIFHPAFGFFAIFAAIVLVGITVANEYSTKEKLAEANNLSRASTIYVDSNIRNAEVVNAMGMRNNISKIWADKYYGFLNAQNIEKNHKFCQSCFIQELKRIAVYFQTDDRDFYLDGIKALEQHFTKNNAFKVNVDYQLKGSEEMPHTFTFGQITKQKNGQYLVNFLNRIGPL